MPILNEITKWTYAPLMLLTFNGAAIALVHSGAPKASVALLLLTAIAMSFLAERFIPYQED